MAPPSPLVVLAATLAVATVADAKLAVYDPLPKWKYTLSNVNASIGAAKQAAQSIADIVRQTGIKTLVGELPVTVAEAIKLKVGAKGVVPAPAGLPPAPPANLTCFVDPDTGIVTGLQYGTDQLCAVPPDAIPVELPIANKAIVGMKVAPAKLGVPTAERALLASLTLEVVDSDAVDVTTAPRQVLTCGVAPAAIKPIELPIPAGHIIRRLGTTVCRPLADFATVVPRGRRLAVPFSSYAVPAEVLFAQFDACDSEAETEPAPPPPPPSQPANTRGLSGLVKPSNSPPSPPPPGPSPPSPPGPPVPVGPIIYTSSRDGVSRCSFSPPTSASAPGSAAITNCALVYPNPNFATYEFHKIYPATGLASSQNALVGRGSQPSSAFVGPPLNCALGASWACATTGNSTTAVGQGFAILGTTAFVTYEQLYACTVSPTLDLSSCAPTTVQPNVNPLWVFGVAVVGTNPSRLWVGGVGSVHKCTLLGTTVTTCAQQTLTGQVSINLGPPVYLELGTSALYGVSGTTFFACPISLGDINVGACNTVQLPQGSSESITISGGVAYVGSQANGAVSACDVSGGGASIGTCALVTVAGAQNGIVAVAFP